MLSRVRGGTCQSGQRPILLGKIPNSEVLEGHRGLCNDGQFIISLEFNFFFGREIAFRAISIGKFTACSFVFNDLFFGGVFT